MAADDSAKVLAKEVAGQMKKVSDQITGPLKSFFPSLISGLPGGQMMQKSFKALSISNKAGNEKNTKAIEKQNALEENTGNVIGKMNDNLAEISQSLTGVSHKLEPDDGSLSAGEVEKANEVSRASEKQTNLLEKISGGIGDMLSGFLNSTAKGAGIGLGAVLGLIAAPIVTLAAFFKSLSAEIKVLDGLLGGKLSAPFLAIKNMFTSIGTKLKIVDKVDDIVLGAKNGIAAVKTFFSGFVGKLNIVDKVDDIILGAKNGIASIKTFFSGFAGKLNIVDKVDDIILGAKNGVASVKTFFSGFKGQISILDTAADLLAPVKTAIASISGYLKPFKALTIFPAAAAAGKTAETAVDGAKSGVKAIQGIMATVKSFMSPLKLGMVALDAGMAVFQPIIKFAGTLGTVLGKIFLPITILMSVFDLVTGFMDGYDEEGTIIGGMEGGISKMLIGLVGIPLDFLKAGIAWLGTKMGFDMKWLSDFSFSEMIGTVVTKLFDGIKGMISFITDLFDFSDLTIFGVFGKLIDIVFLPLNLAINFVKGLFGWGGDDEKEPFSLGTLITDTMTKIFDWFKGLLNIDIGGLIKKIPGAGKILSWFGFGDEEPPVESPEAKQNTLDKERLEQSKDDQALTAMEMEEISSRMDKFERGKNAYLGRDTQAKYDEDKARFDKLVARENELAIANASLQAALEDKDNAKAVNIVQQDNSTTVNGGGQSGSVRHVPISDNSNQWNSVAAIP